MADMSSHQFHDDSVEATQEGDDNTGESDQSYSEGSAYDNDSEDDEIQRELDAELDRELQAMIDETQQDVLDVLQREIDDQIQAEYDRTMEEYFADAEQEQEARQLQDWLKHNLPSSTRSGAPGVVPDVQAQIQEIVTKYEATHLSDD